MLTVADIKDLIPEHHLTDANWQRLIDAETTYLSRWAPDHPDDAEHDMVIVDLCKLRLAYNGLRSMSESGYSQTWENRRECIVSQVATTYA